MLKKTGRAFPCLNPRTIGKVSVLESGDAHDAMAQLLVRSVWHSAKRRYHAGRAGDCSCSGSGILAKTEA